jgi:hypothetical protein
MPPFLSLAPPHPPSPSHQKVFCVTFRRAVTLGPGLPTPMSVCASPSLYSLKVRKWAAFSRILRPTPSVPTRFQLFRNPDRPPHPTHTPPLCALMLPPNSNSPEEVLHLQEARCIRKQVPHCCRVRHPSRRLKCQRRTGHMPTRGGKRWCPKRHQRVRVGPQTSFIKQCGQRPRPIPPDDTCLGREGMAEGAHLD